MPLRVISGRYEAAAEGMLRALARGRLLLGRAVGQEHTLDFATAIVNEALAEAPPANQAMDLRLDEGWTAKAVVEGLGEHYRRCGSRCWSVLGVGGQWAAELTAALEASGWRARPWWLYRLEGYPGRAAPGELPQIIPARAAYEQYRDVMQELAESDGLPARAAEHYATARVMELDEAKLEAFGARKDGRVACVGSLLSLGEVGLVQEVYVGREHRGGGLGAAMLAHLLEAAQRSQFEQVLVSAVEGCPAERLYRGAGFKPIVRFVDYVWPRDDGG